MPKKKVENLFSIILFISYFFLGLIIYKDYGIGIEENFQRQNGFYWLEKLFSILKVEDLRLLAFEKYQSIRSYDPSLPNPEFFNFYGVIFDTPMAFIEIFFNLNDSKLYFEIRHLFNFILFFISAICFYKIIKERFKHEIISILGALLYIVNPRIFGDSFHNSKDVLFLSILTISIFFLFRYFEKLNLKNLIFFCLFASLATSSRIMGLYLPFLVIIFLFTDYLSKKILISSFIKKSGLILFFYILFLYAHFPYMWKLNIFEFISWFNVFFFSMGLNILYDGNYYNIKYLPRLYLPTWISISSPIFILFTFSCGYLFLIKRFFQRLLNLDKNTRVYSDLWRSTNEKKDLFILISLTSFITFAILTNTSMLSGWRHFYFLHIFIIYTSTYMLSSLLIYCKRKKINIFLFSTINLIFICFILKELFIFHPYQSSYFNYFIDNKNNLNFPADTSSLSRSDGLKFIINDSKNSEKIKVANASWTPLYNGKDILNDSDRNKLIFVGNEYNQADYIYTNFNYELDPILNKKYNIPDQFKEIKKMTIKGIPIYSVYKREE